MNPSSLLFWLGSTALLAWIGLLTLHQHRASQCAEQGGRFVLLHWRCIPDTGRIILQRDIRRS